MRSRICPRFLAFLPVLVVYLVAADVAVAADKVVETYQLDGGVLVSVTAGGEVLVTRDIAGVQEDLLVCRWPGLDSRRMTGRPRLFTATAAEGDPGGRRGFHRLADDDGDGWTDEELLDGQDNDGDGAVDEDFAAISDRMAVVNRSRGQRTRHLETYHWSYPHLRSLVAVAWRRDLSEDASVDPVQLELTDETWWTGSSVCGEVPADLTFWSMHHDHFWGGELLYAAVALLEDTPRFAPDQRVRLQGPLLEVPFQADEVVLVFSVGLTPLQVATDLALAGDLWRGAKDPVTEQRVPWLPPAIQSDLPPESVPSAKISPLESGGLTLSFAVTEGQVASFDPDLFRLDDRPLGSPDRFVWEVAGEPAWTLPWFSLGTVDDEVPVDPCAPYAALAIRPGDEVDGTLTFFFAEADESTESLAITPTTLEAVDTYGRRLRPTLVWQAPAVTDEGLEPDAVDPSSLDTVLRDTRLRPTLAPSLLSNYPNPFKLSTTVRFRIPATVAEGFVWPVGEEPLLDGSAPIPYQSGEPQVGVRVYSLEGREVATLASGFFGIGEYQATWDGRDLQGRLMASGTYFCKLQIENWSVTKQLVFIR